MSSLRKRAGDEIDSETVPLFRWVSRPIRGLGQANAAALSAAARGTAHHRFIELADIAQLTTLAGAQSEAQRLESLGLLSPEEVTALDLEAITRFWQASLGRRILANTGNIIRELEFTARFSADDIRGLGVPVKPGIGPDEFVVVQGIVDLVVILDNALWIVDFKTDDVEKPELELKVQAYRPQLMAYGKALGRIYRRPVTEMWIHFLALNTSVAL
ncbi:MAG: PD-(D/E)XK nuclease family protein [Verrucomicrobiae bacterium]|nr:PD-(D/E)XK nuclease family protein [Verrucomicrobiae bacterium]